MKVMRRVLDRLYLGCGILAAICLIGILILIFMQMFSRWLLIPFPGSSEYAGYLMAASSFLAFPYALNAGSHIRVTLFIKAMGKHRFWGELWCLTIGALTTSYLTWYAWKMIYWSVKFGDVSQGQDATPLWIVQTPVAVGATIFAICFWDNLATLLLTGRDNIRATAAQELEH